MWERTTQVSASVSLSRLRFNSWDISSHQTYTRQHPSGADLSKSLYAFITIKSCLIEQAFFYLLFPPSKGGLEGGGGGGGGGQKPP
jgi:hypothetical protein